MDFTPQQQDAITNPAARLCVDAGAGSGKTRVLVERITALVENGVALEQIAAITFTEKAAAEMKSRLRKTFRARAQAAEEDPDAMTRWRDLEQRVDTARISTIHAFCAGFLREYALMLGIDPDFTVLGDAESALLLSDTVREKLIQLLEAQHEPALAMTAEHGTKNLRAMLETMLRQGAAVRQAAARFDYSTPEALYAAWEDLLPAEQAAALAGVRRSPAVLRYIRRLEAFDGKCAVATDSREKLRLSMLEHLRALRAPESDAKAHLEALQAKPGSPRKQNWESEACYDALKAVQDDVRKFADKLLDAPVLDPAFDGAAAGAAWALHVVYGEVAAAWAENKRAANAMDFDGLIEETARVLRTRPEVCAHAAAGLRHLLMDEFQDTDRLQLEIAAHLCNAAGGPDFFFVGDPKQSIYNFRGAEVEIFAEERGRGALPIPLRENFRTLPPLVAFINAFFEATEALSAVGPYATMAAARAVAVEDPHGAPRIEALLVEEQDAAGEERSAEDTRREEARMIAARIAALCADDAAPCVHDEATGGWRRARPGDIALLFRSTSALYLYEEALREAGIDFIATAGAGFHRRQEILDVVNLLRVVVSPRDAAALAAFLRSPLGRVSDDGLLLLSTEGGLHAGWRRGTTPDTLSAHDAAALAEARALIEDLRARRHWPVAAFVAEVYTRTGIEAIVLDHHYGLQKAANLRKLQALALEFSAQTRAPLDRFVRYLAEVAEQEALREGEALMQPFGGGAVTLMTVHKSKGLEFPIVFVCDMGQGQRDPRQGALHFHRELGWALMGCTPEGSSRKPALAQVIGARQAARDEAESARLLYVAMTRARDFLILCGKENPGRGSWFEALHNLHGIAAAAQGEIVRGEAWALRALRVVDTAKPAVRDSATEDLAAVEAALARVAAPLPTVSGPATLSVSALLDLLCGEGSGTDEEAKEEEKGAEQPAVTRAKRRGTLAHRLLECWDFVGAPPVEAVLEEEALAPAEREDMRAALEDIAARFSGLPVCKRLQEATTVERELPFTLRVGDAILNGTIDVLVDGELLIDYKTGKTSLEKAHRYALQLRLYAAALEKIRGRAPREALVVHLDEGREEPVGLDAESVADVWRRVGELLER